MNNSVDGHSIDAVEAVRTLVALEVPSPCDLGNSRIHRRRRTCKDSGEVALEAFEAFPSTDRILAALLRVGDASEAGP